MNLDQKNAHKQIDQLVSWCKLQIYTINGPSDLILGIYTGYQASRSIQGHLTLIWVGFLGARFAMEEEGAGVADKIVVLSKTR